MSIHVALLAAVNVGGRKVLMGPLKEACVAAGWPNTQTYLASGNVLVAAPKGSAVEVARKLEVLVLETSGVATRAIVRSAKQLSAALARNPFQAHAPNLALITFLERAPTKAAIAALAAHNAERDEYVIDGAELFSRFESGVADSKLTPPVIKRILGMSGTARNLNTVAKLRDLAVAMEQG